MSPSASNLPHHSMRGNWVRAESAPGGPARWIGLRAVATIRGGQAEKLVVDGYVPAVQFALGPFGLRPVVNGTQLEQATIASPGAFHLEFPLPGNIMGAKSGRSRWSSTT